MSAADFPLEVDVGLPLHIPLVLAYSPKEAADLTGCIFEAGIRPRAGVDPLIPLTVTVTDAAAGSILISATAEAVQQLVLDSYAWDLILTDPDGIQSVLLRGPVRRTGVISIPLA